VQEPRKYLLLRLVSPILRISGWGLVISGVAVLAIGFAWETIKSGATYADITAAVSYVTLMVGGAALVACGLALIGVGEIMRVVIDIARQTAPIAQMEETVALMLAVLHRMSSQAPAFAKQSVTEKVLVPEGSFPIQPRISKVSTGP